MESWRDKLDKYFNGYLKLFEKDYKITYPCILKRGRIRKESKKHKCNLGKMICGENCCYYCEDRAICRAACNGNPLVCVNSREE